MKCVLQVVKEAHLYIEQKEFSSIKNGYVILVGFKNDDNEEIIKKMMDKLLSLRIFKDENGKTNLSLNDVNGEVMIVSQFTLYADIKKGRRPSFIEAAKGDISKPLYDKTIEYASKILNCKIATGIFGADMEINLTNDGPFTITVEDGDL